MPEVTSIRASGALSFPFHKTTFRAAFDSYYNQVRAEQGLAPHHCSDAEAALVFSYSFSQRDRDRVLDRALGKEALCIAS